jgi:hypothetical protein
MIVGIYQATVCEGNSPQVLINAETVQVGPSTQVTGLPTYQDLSLHCWPTWMRINISVPAILEAYGKQKRLTLHAKSLILGTLWGFYLLHRGYICPAQLWCALGNHQQKRSLSSRRQSGICGLEIPTRNSVTRPCPWPDEAFLFSTVHESFVFFQLH